MQTLEIITMVDTVKAGWQRLFQRYADCYQTLLTHHS